MELVVFALIGIALGLTAVLLWLILDVPREKRKRKNEESADREDVLPGADEDRPLNPGVNLAREIGDRYSIGLRPSAPTIYTGFITGVKQAMFVQYWVDGQYVEPESPPDVSDEDTDHLDSGDAPMFAESRKGDE